MTRIPIEIPAISTYAKNADEFVRHGCRDHTGWRREEWAYSPLFICGKTPGLNHRKCRKMSDLATGSHRAVLLAGMKERWRSSWKKSDRQRQG
jgi:hypothetical protein